MAISGKCDAKFKRVGEEFKRNFKEREEVGASVCVTVEGETVVNLWGGTADIDTGEPWGWLQNEVIYGGCYYERTVAV